MIGLEYNALLNDMMQPDPVSREPDIAVAVGLQKIGLLRLSSFRLQKKNQITSPVSRPPMAPPGTSETSISPRRQFRLTAGLSEA